METKTRKANTSKILAWGCLLSVIGLAAPFGRGPNERLLAATSGSTTMPNCAAAVLTAFNVPDVTITSAIEVPASGADPEYCDVIGSVATHGEGADAGEARFHAKLPAAWNRISGDRPRRSQWQLLSIHECPGCCGFDSQGICVRDERYGPPKRVLRRELGIDFAWSPVQAQT